MWPCAAWHSPPPYCDSGHALLLSIRSMLLDTVSASGVLLPPQTLRYGAQWQFLESTCIQTTGLLRDSPNIGGHLSANTCMRAPRCIDVHQMRSRKQISTIRPSRLPFGQDSRHWAAAVGPGPPPGGLPWPATPPNSNDDRGPEKVYTVRTQPCSGSPRILRKKTEQTSAWFLLVVRPRLQRRRWPDQHIEHRKRWHVDCGEFSS